MPTEHLTYSSYLRLEDILNAQSLRSQDQEHDEMLFIVIHQVYELWFKQMLHELDHLIVLLRSSQARDRIRALHTLRRILTILKTVVTQIDILETMTPLEFNAFRGFLDAASGFQSAQFREIEFLLGRKHPNHVKHFEDHPTASQHLRRRYEEPTLWDAFLDHLDHSGYRISEEMLQRDVTKPVEASTEVQAALVEVYRDDPALSQLCERLVDLDEGIQEWRYRHVKMVERTIGMKRGTGGSPGVGYLATTLTPFFPDLWAIRAQL
jgi:tryptophan 2,3-dioxygenase